MMKPVQTSRRFLTQAGLAFSLIVSFEGRIVILCPKGPSNPTTGAARKRTAFAQEWQLRMDDWSCRDAVPRDENGSLLPTISACESLPAS